MTDQEKLWQGLSASARKMLHPRNYDRGELAARLSTTGMDAAEVIALDRTNAAVRELWIPGVEIFPRTIHRQRHRGMFGEFVRRDEGILATIGFWPVQWSSARMFGHSAKGFHVHPPHIPAGKSAADWMRKLFVDEPTSYSERPYDREQWDVIFFVQGVAEIILRDVRDGMPKRTMRFFVEGDNYRSASNAGFVVPPGVAHAVRAEGSEDVIMVYGTSTSFQPEFEGRIASDIETAELPDDWRKFLSS